MSVPTALHLQSRFFAVTRKLWHLLGRLESSVLADELETVKITQPLYVSGLARSGTTILTEMLEKHPAVTSHRYSDFPNIWTPYWRNYLLQKTRYAELQPAERTHKDRIQITNDSPEAFEEVLWMYFFPQAHARGRPNTLDGMVSNPAFESFYRDHIRKLLAVRASSRYLAKGNYNISRFGYILKIFPDARFLVLYRNPVNHIASLIKQHKYFLQAHAQDPRVGKQLAFTGHFEFGPFRNVIHFGHSNGYQGITDAWSEGREVEGWALYWAETYRFLLQQMQADPALKTSLLLINYEELCERSEQAIDRIIDHCWLDHEVFTEVRQYYCEHLRPPTYYQPDFTAEETALIEQICAPVLADLDNSRS